MKAIIAHDGVKGRENGKTIDRPRGSVVENPDVWKSVLMGVAVPGDDECRAKAGLSNEEIARRVKAYKKMNEENIILQAHGIETAGEDSETAESSGGFEDDDSDEE